MNFNRKIWILIGISTLIRILTATSLQLGNDEVYYQTYPLFLQWNYFDHPPIIALLLRLTTFNLHFHQELFVRAGPIICSAIGTWLIYKIGILISGPRVGWFAAIFYSTSFYASVISGTFILPDSPQSVFWLFSIYLMIRILDDWKISKTNPLLFIFLGISIGLCILSKIHGVFLWFGFGAYLIFNRKNSFTSPMLWVSGLITLVIISPIYLWNSANHFITYRYHAGRVGFWGSHPDTDRLIQQVLGSVFYSNPVNFIFYFIALYFLIKKFKNSKPEWFLLLLWLSFPLIIILLWTSLFFETLPHWSGPAYFSLMICAAYYLHIIPIKKNIGWLKASIITYCFVIIAGITIILFLPASIGSKEPRILGKGDITLDMTGWKSFSFQMDSLYQSDAALGKMKPGAVLITDYWFPAGHLDYYFASPNQINLYVFGKLNDIHHFAWLNARRPPISQGTDAYFIYPSNYYGPPGQNLKSQFKSVEDSILIPQFRTGIPVRNFVIYRMHSFKGDSSSYLFPGIY